MPLTTPTHHALPLSPCSTSATSPIQIHPQPQKPQRGGRPACPRCPPRNHERVWFRLEQGSHLFWAHLCWLTHVLTGKLAACSMGRGSTSPVGYQCLTCPPSFWAPSTSAHHKFKCTNSHPLPPPTHSNQPSSPLYFYLYAGSAIYISSLSLKLKNCHCFIVTFGRVWGSSGFVLRYTCVP